MPFSSLLFLSAFLPAFLAAYWVAPRALKNTAALVFSILFYAWGAPRLLPAVLVLGVLDYYLGNAIARSRERGASSPEAARRARLLLLVGVSMHLSVLAYFKYSNFLVAQTNDLLGVLPRPLRIVWTEVPLPIGISFLTFEEISYLTDVYRGHARPARSLGRYMLFLMLFPHSIAGPIFRWKDLEAQLDEREHSLRLVASGMSRFTLGIAKKVLVADAAALAVDPIYAADPRSVGPALAWTAAIAYTLQIYFDFSGYSDMAIGLGRMAGFRFKENFDAPYIAASITEFWKRWHISLSTWLRDYLYIPLGGNRFGEHRTRWNILVVFTLSGLWHGAAWTFVAWGVFHGLLSAGERTALGRAMRTRAPHALNVASTLFFVMVGWVLFRAPTLKSAGTMLGAMFFVRQPSLASGLLAGQLMPTRSICVLSLAAAAAVAPAVIGERRAEVLERRLAPAAVVLVPLGLILAMAQLANSTFTPLIYFKF